METFLNVCKIAFFTYIGLLIAIAISEIVYKHWTDDTVSLRRRCFCKLGWHEWVWLLSSVPLSLNGIPDHAKCKHCGITYKTVKDCTD